MQSSRSVEAARPSASGTPAPLEFQRQWQAGQPPPIEAFLSQRPAISVTELAAVTRIDLRQRLRCGEQLGASGYLTRFPQLLTDASLAVDLIYTEFLVREELGERLHLPLLQQQFPQYADELTAQVEFHYALEGSDSLESSESHASEQQNSDQKTSAKQPYSGNESKQPDQTSGVREKSRTRFPSLGPGYEILAEIGRGGMGIVYRARQVGLNRLVALKMVRGADYASEELLERFRTEAEAVARLHHPQIVQIYDYGEHDGLPYLALELLEGGTLADRLDGTPWPSRQAATLLETLSRAAGFAHQHGIIHRDLKPANILLQKSEIRSLKSDSANALSDLCPPTSDLCVKIADFGLAKAFHENSYAQTQTGALLGTPSYMAPEQAAGHASKIGPTADVYSLGAILYELLTGRPPFRGETPMATLQQVLASEPVSIRLLTPNVPHDLATICSKCLRREPDQRYQSAAELADDLARHLSDQPIRARPISRAERAWRWCRRNPALATLAGTVALLLIAVAGISSLASIRLGDQLQKTARAEDAERSAKLDAQARLWDSYVAEITARTASRQIGQRTQSLATVDQASALLPEIGSTPQRVRRLRNATIAALALPDISPVYSASNWWLAARQSSYCSSADRCSAVTSQGELAIYRISDGQKLFSVLESGVNGFSVISPDGRFVALIQKGAKVWRIDGSEPTIVWQEPNSTYFTFSPDGRHAAASGADGIMRLIDIELGTEVRRLGQGAARSEFAFHVPSQRIAVRVETTFQIISSETGEVLQELPLADSTSPSNRTFSVAWHPSGEHLLVGSATGGAMMWHVASATRAMVYPHRSQDIRVKFIGGGDVLCTYSTVDGSMVLWHTGTGRELLADTTFNNFAPDQSPSGGKIFRLSLTHLEVFELATARECTSLSQGLNPSLQDVYALDISPDGRLLAISRGKGLELWDLASGRHWLETNIKSSLIKFTDNGDLIVSGSHSITRWPRKTQSKETQPATSASETYELAVSYGPPHQLSGKSDDYSFAIDPSGQTFAVEPPWNGCRVIHADKIREDKPEGVVRLLTPETPRRMALSSDGRWVAVANSVVSDATVFNAITGQVAAKLTIGPNCLPLFSPDNRWLALSSYGARVWRVTDWQQTAILDAPGQTPSAQEIAFSSDSRVLAVRLPSGVIRLIDPATGDDFAVLTDPDGSSGGFLAFTPDQTKLVTMASGEQSVPRIWDLTAIRHELASRGLDWPPDILPKRPNANSIPDSKQLSVTFDIGNFAKKEEALALYRKTGKLPTDKALDLLQQAVETDPEFALAHNNIAWLLATGPETLRDPELALKHARRAVALEPGHQGHLNTLGISLCRNAQYEEAVRVLDRSFALSTNDSASFDMLFLALAHAGEGNTKTAQDYYAKAKAWHDSHNAGSPSEFSRLYNEARSAIIP
jgi:serine/threonine protein kinase/WD40 repeat protein